MERERRPVLLPTALNAGLTLLAPELKVLLFPAPRFYPYLSALGSISGFIFKRHSKWVSEGVHHLGLG